MPKTDHTKQLEEQANSAMAQDRWQDAIKLLKRDAAIVRKNWRLSWTLGWCYFQLNRQEDARRYLIRATDLAPENPVCLFALGNVYLQKKQFKKAEATFAKSYAAFLSDAGREAEAQKMNDKAAELRRRN